MCARSIPLAVSSPKSAHLQMAGRPYIPAAGVRALAPIDSESAAPTFFLLPQNRIRLLPTY